MTPVILIRRVLELIGPRMRGKLVSLALLILASALLEMLGIGLILPLLQLILAPSQVANVPGVGWALRTLFDGNSERMLITLGCGIIIFYLLKNAFLAWIIYLQKKFIFNAQAEFQVRLYAVFLSKDFLFHLSRNSSETIRTVIHSASTAFSNVLLPALQLATEAVLMIAAALMVFLVEPIGALVSFSLLGVLLTGAYLVTRWRFANWGRLLEELAARNYLWVAQGLNGIKETLVFQRRDYFVEKFRRSMSEAARVKTLESTSQEGLRLFGEFAAVLTIGLLFAIVAWSRGSIAETLPVVGVFAAASLRILPSLNRIVHNAGKIHSGSAAVEILRREIGANSLPGEPRPASLSKAIDPIPHLHKAIELRNVQFSYPGAIKPTVANVNLTIPSGATVAFVGASGAGKSSIVDLIMGLTSPNAGSIAVDGIDIRGDLPRWREQIGYVPQDVYLLDDTVANNVAFGLDLERENEIKIWEALEKAQLADVIHSLPDGLASRIGERGTMLSGGERQRLGIARALYREPRVLILDEATSALDNATEHRISKFLNDVRGTMTVIMIAHRMTTIRHCDILFVIDDGHLVGFGNYETLLTDNPTFRRLAGRNAATDEEESLHG